MYMSNMLRLGRGCWSLIGLRSLCVKLFYGKNPQAYILIFVFCFFDWMYRVLK